MADAESDLATSMETATGVLARDVERFALEQPGGARRLEGRGELSLARGCLSMRRAAGGASDFSVRLGGAGVAEPGGGFGCAWARGSRELWLSAAGQPPCFVLLVHDSGADMAAIATALGAAVLPADGSGGEAPELVLLAASAIDGTSKLAASVLTSGAALFGSGMGLALQAFKTNVRRAARPRLAEGRPRPAARLAASALPRAGCRLAG